MKRFAFFTFFQIIFCFSEAINESITRQPVQSSQCEEDWHQFGRKCFKYHKDQAGANFHDSFSICEYSYQATLVTIHSEEEFNFISKMAFDTNHAKYSIWIGLVRVSNTSFVWFDRSQLNFTNWGPNEPNNWQSKNYCVVMSSAASAKGKWFDVGCTTTYLVMCQKYLHQTIVSLNYTDSDISIADEINMKSDDMFKSEQNVDRNLDKHELEHVKVLGNVNIVLTTMLFIIIFVFILSNYSLFSFPRIRRNNHFTSLQNTIDKRNSFDI